MQQGELPITIVGVLHQSTVGNYSVRINRLDILQFEIKPISNVPESLSNIESFTSYASDIASYYDDNVYGMSKDDRVVNFIDFIKDKLIIFKPFFKEGGYACVSNKDQPYPKIITIPKYINLNSRLINIPKNYDSLIDLEKKLLNNEPISLSNRNISENDNPYIPIIYNKSYFYGEVFVDNISPKGIVLTTDQTLKRLPLNLDDEKYKGFIVKHLDNIWIENNFLNEEILPWLDKYGQEVNPTLEYDSGMSQNQQEESPIEDLIIKEEVFIKILKSKALIKNLYYDDETLINFHTALKTKGLIILNGMSGTGKSKLVEIYAQALNIYTRTQFKMISVKPNWTDDSDLIGFVDTINNVYRPAESGLIDILLEAEKHEDDLYLVCFDEMNLSRVEHYFSQFLSVLEMSAEYKKLRLYNPELQNRIYNSNIYKPEITIKDNILFVGTVNIDESTYRFSDKVLDRSNVINICTTTDFSRWILNKDANIEEYSIKNYVDEAGRTYVEMKDFNSWIKDLKLPNPSSEDELKEIAFFNELNKELQKINSMFGIGYRVLVQIYKYINNIPGFSFDIIDRRKAFDYQVVQKIVPKIRGTYEQLNDLIGQDGSILELLDKYIDISEFDETRRMLLYKQKEIETNGFTA